MREWHVLLKVGRTVEIVGEYASFDLAKLAMRQERARLEIDDIHFMIHTMQLGLDFYFSEHQILD